MEMLPEILKLLALLENSPLLGGVLNLFGAYLIIKHALVKDIKKDFLVHFDTMADTGKDLKDSVDGLRKSVEELASKVAYVQRTHWDEIKEIKKRLNEIDENQ